MASSARAPLGLALCLWSCGPAALPEASPDPAPVASLAAPTGPVVATVDGTPISLAEVEDVARRTGLSPREALRRLEEELVLVHAAGAPDEETLAEADAVARRAAVQALIEHDVEASIGAETLGPAEVAARLEHDRPMFAQPERRASVHVLCAPDRGAPPEAEAAAERFCRNALEALREASDPRALAATFASAGDDPRTFSVRVEPVPAARREGDVVAEYADALFALPGLGVVPEVIHSRFGYHAIILTEIVAPWAIPDDEAERIVRRQMVVEARATALDALGTELMAGTVVVLDDQGVALAMTRHLDGAPSDAAPP